MVSDFFGYQIFSGSLRECCIDIADSILNSNKKTWLACLNPHSFITANDRVEFKRALAASDWLIPDGAGIVIASRILGAPVQERITGPDMFHCISEILNDKGEASVYFLGSTDGVLKDIRKRMSIDWPRVNVAGSWSPPFKHAFCLSDTDEMIARINAAKPDVLWVGLTAPKQEELIYDLLPRLDVKFAAAIGAAFDFYSGNVKRSHSLFRRFGLEWLPRLIRQPRRLWRRTFVSAPRFILLVALEFFSKRILNR